MNLSFRNRVLVTIFIACVICTSAAVVVSYLRVKALGDNALVEKSRVILSRLEVGREYIADMGVLDGQIKRVKNEYPDGNIPKSEQSSILKAVPIFASFQLGQTRAEEENYKFRIITNSPRNKDNLAVGVETEWLRRFTNDPSLKEIVQVDYASDTVNVVRPVRLSERQGCMTCHGSAATSPWGDGRDILGYDMENMNDGDLKGAFVIKSSLAPVRESTQSSLLNIVMWAAGFTVLSLVLGFLMVRGPLKMVAQVIDDVSNSANQVNDAARQVSSASQSMAEGASEQAASLEETSSTLEEIASTTRQNADNSQNANQMADQARNEVEKGSTAMTRMIEAIREIKVSSDQTARIIKTIDEIAFQTNLLALNAAVEAARAGDAGRGFAVVAEEVRALALRSAEAAKDTSAMIEAACERAETGVGVANEVETSLNEIRGNIERVVTIIGEVASASDEQRKGVDQVNIAVAQMDQVTQSNAASAEQTASASEELSAQSQQMLVTVNHLARIVGTGTNGDQREQGGGKGNGNGASRHPVKSDTRPALPAERGIPRRIAASPAHPVLRDVVPTTRRRGASTLKDEIARSQHGSRFALEPEELDESDFRDIG